MEEAKAQADADTTNEVDVLACNWDAVTVFQACQLTRVVGMTRIVCTGIAAAEIVAALRLCGIARRSWQSVGDGARLMGMTAAQAINEASAR